MTFLGWFWGEIRRIHEISSYDFPSENRFLPLSPLWIRLGGWNWNMLVTWTQFIVIHRSKKCLTLCQNYPIYKVCLFWIHLVRIYKGLGNFMTQTSPNSYFLVKLPLRCALEANIWVYCCPLLTLSYEILYGNFELFAPSPLETDVLRFNRRYGDRIWFFLRTWITHCTTNLWIYFSTQFDK